MLTEFEYSTILQIHKLLHGDVPQVNITVCACKKALFQWHFSLESLSLTYMGLPHIAYLHQGSIITILYIYFYVVSGCGYAVRYCVFQAVTTVSCVDVCSFTDSIPSLVGTWQSALVRSRQHGQQDTAGERDNSCVSMWKIDLISMPLISYK